MYSHVSVELKSVEEEPKPQSEAYKKVIEGNYTIAQ